MTYPQPDHRRGDAALAEPFSGPPGRGMSQAALWACHADHLFSFWTEPGMARADVLRTTREPYPWSCSVAAGSPYP